MASLKAIRNRIRSVKSTQQITRAMKMVAAAKLRRSQDAVMAARPYAQKIEEVLQGVVERVDLADCPLLAKRPEKRAQIVLITSDRGMCGGFNGNVIRRAQQFVNEAKFGSANSQGGTDVAFRTVGRKGNDFFRRRANVIKDYPGLLRDLNYQAAADMAAELRQSFEQGEVDAVYLVYNEFVSVISQRVKLVKLLPIELAVPTAHGLTVRSEYLFEPNAEQVLQELLPRSLASVVWRALLESSAAEQGARMSAMESATKNASEMIDRLTMQYNRKRQAGITTELMEIVSGAEALK